MGPFTYDFDIHNSQTSHLELVDLEPLDMCRPIAGRPIER